MLKNLHRMKSIVDENMWNFRRGFKPKKNQTKILDLKNIWIKKIYMLNRLKGGLSTTKERIKNQMQLECIQV